MSSWARKLERRTEERLDRRVLIALIASSTITLLLVAPYLFRAI